ncbi:acyl carrier protein [Streptomyces sp. MAR4 CNX-425]|uniref:acyl carrier protein n=1 Tax=Streptomyces sp. MAR4 CNX-425 TaxID=3406343 RepID=UPI003B507F63
MNDVYERFVNLLGGFGVQADEVRPERTFNDLDFDSLALVEIALVVQSEFGVSVDDDELTAEATVARATEVIKAKLVAV